MPTSDELNENLRNAIIAQNLEQVVALIGQNADVNAKGGVRNNTPLHVAVYAASKG